MGDNASKILALWHELIGSPDYVPEDLSDIWVVQLGSATESLNLDWYERKVGHYLRRRGEVVFHPGHEWAACTLDGWDDLIPGPVEAKHVGGREPLETIIARYSAQLHWQMLVTDTRRCALSVIMGANEPIVEMIDLDDAYAAVLWERASAFMRCVQTLTPPVECAAVEPPVRPERTVSMQGSNIWASAAATWLEHRHAATIARDAEKELKGLVPADAIRCHGHGIFVSRDRAGRLSLRSE